MRKSVINIVLQLLPLVVILVLWEGYIWLYPTKQFFYGAPSGVVKEFRFLISTGTLIRDFWTTFYEAFLGFVFGTTLGTCIGLVLWSSRTIYMISKPYLIFLGSVPVFALGPVLIFWFGTGVLSKVVLAFLATFVIAIVQAYDGASKANINYVNVIKSFGGTRWQIFQKVIVPSSILSILTGIRLNIGMALIGAFIGEFVASRKGLGNLIIVAEGLYNVNQIWVGIMGIAAIAFIFHLFTYPIEKWAIKFKTH